MTDATGVSVAKLFGSGSSFVKVAKLCSCGPVAAHSQHDAAAAPGVLVPGIVTVHPAHRTNRVSTLDAIDQAVSFTKLEPEPNNTNSHSATAPTRTVGTAPDPPSPRRHARRRGGR